MDRPSIHIFLDYFCLKVVNAGCTVIKCYVGHSLVNIPMCYVIAARISRSGFIFYNFRMLVHVCILLLFLCDLKQVIVSNQCHNCSGVL